MENFTEHLLVERDEIQKFIEHLGYNSETNIEIQRYFDMIYDE